MTEKHPSNGTLCAVFVDRGAAVAVLGALFGVTGLRVAQLIDDSVH